MTASEIRHRVDIGAWQRLAQGTYARGAIDPALDEHAARRVAHVRHAVAAHRRRPGSVLCGRTAAVAHGLPLATADPADAELANGSRAGRVRGVFMRADRIPDEDLVRIGDTTASSVLRTVLDVARAHGVADGLACADAALRGGALTSAALLDAAHGLPPRARGRRLALIVAGHADGRRESPMESWSWARFLEWRLPLPEPQWTALDGAGRFLARTDFWWASHRLVGECDGLVKYRSRDDLVREKRREDRLRAEGFAVVRWGARELRLGWPLRDALLRAGLSPTSHRGAPRSTGWCA